MFVRITILAIGFTPTTALACIISPPVLSPLLLIVATLCGAVFLVDTLFRSDELKKRRRESAKLYLIAYLILFAFVVVAFFTTPGCPGPARVPKAKTEIRNIVSALQMYKLDNQVYPGTVQGLLALVRKPDGSPKAKNWEGGGYLSRIPVDPWGREYLYEYLELKDEIQVYSLGRDGKPGGTGEDADLYGADL